MITLLVVIGLALIISFACSVLEAVLLSTSHSFIAVLRERGDRAGELLADMRESIDQPIAAILTLNTIGNTMGAAWVVAWHCVCLAPNGGSRSSLLY